MQPALTVPDNEAKELKSTRPRKRLPLSFVVAGIAVLTAVIYLVYANTQTNAVYYMTIPELKHCATCSVQTVRVEGVVQAGSIVRNDQAHLIDFVITDGSQTMPVNYTGIVPDIFRAGAQVVVEGRYAGQGAFQAQTLLTKCPSKFQSATPAASQ